MSSTSSITDVAALARVSKATVSRVLSGRRTKDDNIAKRVRDAAEQLNYQANSAASALRSDTTNTIGLIMPGPTDPLAARLLAELEPEVNRSGRQLLLGLGDDQRTGMRSGRLGQDHLRTADIHFTGGGDRVGRGAGGHERRGRHDERRQSHRPTAPGARVSS